MACNENIIKNMANEITRNCHYQGVTVDVEFVTYIIELLLLNPKYGKDFIKTIKRTSLEFFVNECVEMLIRGETPIHTLKMQFIMQTNYDKLYNLIDKHLDSITLYLRPLVSEILEAEPNPKNETEFWKLFRKISIYIILSSGLGNPGTITTLKHGMAALSSVFSKEDLTVFIDLPRPEKMGQLHELTELVSGVRLFNKDCKKAGEVIPDLPFKIVDAGKACLSALSNALIGAMQRVNSLTTAVADVIAIQDETGNILIEVPENTDLTKENYIQIFDILAFYRQYVVFVKKLLSDVEIMVTCGTQNVEKVRAVLEELHAGVKYKAAVPVATVYPLFKKLWSVWRTLQNVMYLMSTVNRIMSSLGNIQDQVKIPYNILEEMLQNKVVVTDQDRMNCKISMTDRLNVGTLKNYISYDNVNCSDKYVQYLGFCALCLSVGALVPSNNRVGLIKINGLRYGFCNVTMAACFSKEPQRYINEVLHYARNNPHIINLLNIKENVEKVKYIDNLVTRIEPKIKVLDKDIQTEAHPMDTYIDRDYLWDMWEVKRRACQWASIVNCRTHATQTNYSHLRSEICCQTVEPRHKCLQTKRDASMNTYRDQAFIWGLRGTDKGQHVMDLTEKHSQQRQPVKTFEVCTWPCIEADKDSHDSGEDTK